MEKTPSDIIDQYIENHNKAKRWTLFWVLIFCLLATGLIILSVKNKELIEENALLKAQQDIQSADSAKQAVEISLENTTATVEKLQQENDLNTLEIERLSLHNRKLISIQNNQPVQQIDDSLKKIQAKVIATKKYTPVKPVTKIIAAPAATAAPADNSTAAQSADVSASSIVYIQYMPGFSNYKDKVSAALKSYTVRAPELIERITFNSTVKYFNESDEKAASHIAQVVSSILGSTVQAKFTRLKVPAGQIEVWLGQYKAADISEIRKKINASKK